MCVCVLGGEGEVDWKIPVIDEMRTPNPNPYAHTQRLTH